MRKIFNDTDELMFFVNFLKDNLNQQINKKTEDTAIVPTILISTEQILAIIETYEGSPKPVTKNTGKGANVGIGDNQIKFYIKNV